MDWSDIGNVATTVGVLLALLVALSGAWRQQRANHREQATRVSVHLEQRRNSGIVPGGGPWEVRFDAAIVVNASSSPICEVVIGAGSRTSADPEFIGGNDANLLVYVIPPGAWAVAEPRGLRLDEPELRRAGAPTPKRPPDTQRGPTITFKDGNGATWERNARGVLGQIKGSPIAARELTEPFPSVDPRSD